MLMTNDFTISVTSQHFDVQFCNLKSWHEYVQYCYEVSHCVCMHMLHIGLQVDYKCIQMTFDISMLKKILLLASQYVNT